MIFSKNIISIPKPRLFSFAECLYFLDRGYDDCLYSIENNSVLKPLQVDGSPLILQVRDDIKSLSVEIVYGETSGKNNQFVVDYVTKWFDLEQDLQPFYRMLDQHPQLAFMPEQYQGLRLMGIPDLFEALCWCVIGQQINLTFAYRLKRRLVETYGSSVSYQSNPYYYFPKPEQIAELTVDELKKMQFSRRKAEYLIGIAGEFTEGNISRQKLLNLSDTDSMLKQLTEIRGVGEWTANYVLMKSLKRMDCITFGDSGLMNAVSSVLELKQKPTRKEIQTLFRPFAGWESYLVIYLWRTLSTPSEA